MAAHLLLVGADHVVDGDVGTGRKMIGAGAGGDQRAGNVLGGVEAPADQFERRRPVDAHAALRGVHRLGDAEPERPQMPAKGDGALPVDGGVEPGIAVGERIGDHVRRRIGDAVERRLRRRERARRLHRVGREFATGDGKIERGHVEISNEELVARNSEPASGERIAPPHHTRRITPSANPPYICHTLSGGMSIQRRSFQLRRPASASCTPLAPSSSVHLNGASS